MRKFILMLLATLLFVTLSADAITIGMYVDDENHRVLIDQMTYDLCTYVYDCFHQLNGSFIIPVSSDISILFVSLKGKNGGLSNSTYNESNLKAIHVNTAGESDMSERALQAVWSEEALQIDPAAAVFTAEYVATSDVEAVEITARTYYVQYAEKAKYAAHSRRKSDTIISLEDIAIGYEVEHTPFAHFTNHAGRLLSASPPVYYSQSVPKIYINDNQSSY
jgi:hypothetical protein